jgi:arylsulfatase A-like enzyme
MPKPFQGEINLDVRESTPDWDAFLADNGLTYSQWHTTALCSPTRSTFLTGRNIT